LNTIENNYIKFENNTIHIIIDNNNKLWFNANDSAKAIGYIDRRDAIKRHVNKKDKIQKRDINCKKMKGHGQTLYLTEGGLYSLILTSKLPKAKKFSNWVTHEVLPSIRKYGEYKLKKEMDDMMRKINYLEEENKKMINLLKKNKYPKGGMVYVIDYSDSKNSIYRIGMTGDMTKRKQLYDTHMLDKKEIKIMEETKCPIRLESCIRAMLYEYRYKDKKDFYVCDIKIIKKAFKTCIKSIECMNQIGGVNLIDKELENLIKIKNKLENMINSEQNYKYVLI
jgi:prophage antirepressor-like protein